MSNLEKRNVIKTLVSSFNEEKSKLEDFSKTVSSIDHDSLCLAMSDYTLLTIDGYSSVSFFEIAQFPLLVKKLTKKYWSKVFEISEVRSVMPSTRLQEWEDTIENGDLPEFNMDNVFSTAFDFFNSKRKYMSEKADGILKSLSSNHKTNMSDQITEKFILENVVYGKFDQLNYTLIGKINDLRSLISQIKNEDAYFYSCSQKMIADLHKYSPGKWIYVDGNNMRLKVYKKGTVHIELNPEIIEDIAMLLSELYPMQISDKKGLIQIRKEFKNFPLLKDRISTGVGKAIMSASNYGNQIKRFDLQYKIEDGVTKLKEKDLKLQEYPYNFNFKKIENEHEQKQVENLLLKLGVVKQQYLHFTWYACDFNIIPLLHSIAYSGVIDDYKSYQFYPTKKNLAKKVINCVEIKSGMKVLEPSAGQGGICQYLDINKDLIDCVEISEINKKILTLKGYNVVGDDFLKFSEKTKNKYDRIVMNPPFSNGRAKLHVQQASKLLNENGILAAIIPASFKGKVIVEGFEHTYSEVFSEEFDNTNVSVVIVTMQKK